MKIGIEKTLTNVREYLEQNNHKTVELSQSKKDTKKIFGKFDAIVVSGMDSNYLGIQDTMSKTPVINADGKTAEEVYKEIQNRLG